MFSMTWAILEGFTSSPSLWSLAIMCACRVVSLRKDKIQGEVIISLTGVKKGDIQTEYVFVGLSLSKRVWVAWSLCELRASQKGINFGFSIFLHDSWTLSHWMRLVFGCDINGISSIKIYNLLHCVCFLNWSSTIEKPIIIQFQFQLNDAFCNKSFTAERDSRKFSFDLRYLLYGRSIKFNLCIIVTRCTIFF